MAQPLPEDRAKTAARRRVQPLWSALDRVLGPRVAAGALLCVSGGPDSTALLEAAATWPGRARGPLVVATVDHGLRRTAAAEGDAVAARAHALGFDAVALTAPGEARDEASLRARRYRVLEAEARRRGLEAMVTAHHADDVAEAALLRTLGLAPVGSPGEVAEREELVLLRPFLTLPRAVLLAARAGPAFLDPEDRGRGNARGQLREGIAPALDGRVNWRGPAAADAQKRHEDDDVVAGAVDALFEGGARLEIPLPQPAAVLRRLVQRFVGAEGKRARKGALDTVVLACNEGRASAVDLPGARARISRDRLVLERA
jgi:hypothetical protein